MVSLSRVHFSPSKASSMERQFDGYTHNINLYSSYTTSLSLINLLIACNVIIIYCLLLLFISNVYMNISTRRQHVKNAGRPSQLQDTDTETMNGHALLHRLRSANCNRDHRIIKRPLPGIKTLTKIHSAKERFILGKVGS